MNVTAPDDDVDPVDVEKPTAAASDAEEPAEAPAAPPDPPPVAPISATDTAGRTRDRRLLWAALAVLALALAARFVVLPWFSEAPWDAAEVARPPLPSEPGPPAPPEVRYEPLVDLPGAEPQVPAVAERVPPTGPARTSRPADPEPPAALDPRYAGTLHVVSEPPGAEVWVDGKMVGETPVTVQELAGLARVRVVREGFEIYHRSLSIEAGQRAELGPLVLEPLPEQFGTVELFGVGLDGGTVAVDGGPKVALPARVDLIAGVHRFEVFAPEGEVYTVARDITYAGAGDTVQVDLQEL
ncbi:MAG: PEGA domain-containing protein [Pseudomonadota bacterium]